MIFECASYLWSVSYCLFDNVKFHLSSNVNKGSRESLRNVIPAVRLVSCVDGWNNFSRNCIFLLLLKTNSLTGFIIINNLNSNEKDVINLTISYFIRYNYYHHHLKSSFCPRLIDPSMIFLNVFHYSAYNWYFTITFGPSFIIAEMSELCLSHLKYFSFLLRNWRLK